MIERIKSAMVGLGASWVLYLMLGSQRRFPGHHARACLALLVPA